MWIGVISNSSGCVEEQAKEIFAGVDYILHCGNAGSQAVLEEYSIVAPITGVLGDIDDPEFLPFQYQLFKKWFDIGVFVQHAIGDPFNLSPEMKSDLARLLPEVVLFGLGSEPFNARVENRLFFHPGSCGAPSSRHPRSVGLLEIDGQTVRAEVVPIA